MSEAPGPPTQFSGFFKAILCAVLYCCVALVLFQRKQNPTILKNVSKATTDTQQHGRLWIQVSGWGEGMAGWTLSLSEVLLLAQALKATLVEPCIANGRLMKCDNTSRHLTLSEMFDIEDLFQGEHPLLASYEHFQQQTRAVTLPHFVFCCTKPKWQKRCRGGPNRRRRRRIPEVQKAIDELEVSPHVLLEISYMWRDTLQRFWWGARRIATSWRREAFRSKHFYTFHPQHYEYVDQLLRYANLTTFSAIHWRGELPNLDYVACAHDVVQTRNNMDKESAKSRNGKNHTSWVLMSSLNEDPNLMWAGALEKAKRGVSSPEDALSLLTHQEGFSKLDNMLSLQNLTDSSLLAVWDLILASRADQFATCARSCPKHSACAKCNYQGKFGEMAVAIRARLGKSTDKCWPL